MEDAQLPQLGAAVSAALAELDLPIKLIGVAALAQAYATSIDEFAHDSDAWNSALRDLGPKLLAALAACGATLDVKPAAAPKSAGALAAFRTNG